MKKLLILLFFIVTIFKSTLTFGDIEKGKWNFVKDVDYCYIGSAPITIEIPKDKKRGDVYILVYRINKKPDAIIQISAGYTYKNETPVKVKIDKKVYEFYSEDDSAWTNDDNTIIYAMKMGVELVVTGFSNRETKTIDTYTLNGFTAAYNKLTKDC